MGVWIGLASPTVLSGQALSGPTSAGWRAYVAAAEARVARERGQAISGREAVSQGQITVDQVRLPGPDGYLDVDDATINHWRGLVLIPGARLEDVVSRLEREPPDTRQQDVLASAVIGQRPGWLKVSLRIRRSFIVTAVFDTEHEATFVRHSPSRASSQSTATRIVEIDNAGTAREREKRPDEDRGLLWRWNAYWRYEQVDGGVIVECESVTLSCPSPTMLKPVLNPVADKIAKESMERTLATLRTRFSATAVQVAGRPLESMPAR